MFMHWMLSHDWNLIALSGAVLILGLVIALEVRGFARMRQEVVRDMARVFEQLDLVRFEVQQMGDAAPQAASAPVAAARSFERAPDNTLERASQRAPGERGILAATPAKSRISSDSYSDAARMAADGAQAHEIAMKCGLAAGEARILVGLQAARSRRLAT